MFVLFLTAGDFKGEPWLAWLPIDLTLLGAVATAVLVIVEAHRQSWLIPRAVFVLLPLFVAFLPSLFWTEWIPYAVDKARYFFTLTLLATLAPTVLLTTPERVRRLVNTITLAALVVAVETFYLFFADPVRYERLGVDASLSTIAIGSLAGFACIWIATLMLSGRLNSLLALGLIGFLASILIGVGSRGPLLLCAVPLIGVLLLCGRGSSALLRLLGLVTVAVIGLQIGLQVAPSLATSRVETFVQGQLGTSEQVRIEDASLAWAAIQDNPLGIGLGGFTARLVPWRQYPGPFARDFPHNIVLEAFLEGGWLAGSVLSALLAIALGKSLWLAVKTRFRVEFAGLFAVLLYIMLNDLVSGELNDSRLLFAFVGTALGLPSLAQLQQQPSAQSGPVADATPAEQVLVGPNPVST